MKLTQEQIDTILKAIEHQRFDTDIRNRYDYGYGGESVTYAIIEKDFCKNGNYIEVDDMFTILKELEI